MLRKVKGAWRMLRTRGLGAVIGRIGWYRQRWWTSDHWWVGRIVELTGNRARLDGARFDLSSPLVGTPQKAGFLLGNYEYGERVILRRIPADIGLPIVELGGSIGVVACISNRYFDRPKHHVVIEANPYLIPVLTRNRDLNDGSFEVVQAALAYGADEITFHVHPKFVKSSLYALDSSAEVVQVPTLSLRQILEQRGFDGRILLLCDVEGAETGLFEHESDVLRERVKYFALEVHAHLTGSHAVERMLGQLTDWGFRQLFRIGDNYLFCNEHL
jgi:FkbM family methyltransferase